VTDLLALSRVSRDSTHVERVDLNVIAREVLSDLEVRVRELDAAVEVGQLPAVIGDPTQMRQLFQNLLGNGLKFHRPGVAPCLSITSSGSNGSCRVSFRDSGIGFDEQYAEQIFAPFRRLHARQQFEGTGLGLALCRRIVERCGGSIEARAKPGAGSTFMVTLPRWHDTDLGGEGGSHG
jgi:signal transduction histidine kinase